MTPDIAKFRLEHPEECYGYHVFTGEEGNESFKLKVKTDEYFYANEFFCMRNDCMCRYCQSQPFEPTCIYRRRVDVGEGWESVSLGELQPICDWKDKWQITFDGKDWSTANQMPAGRETVRKMFMRAWRFGHNIIAIRRRKVCRTCKRNPCSPTCSAGEFRERVCKTCGGTKIKEFHGYTGVEELPCPDCQKRVCVVCEQNPCSPFCPMQEFPTPQKPESQVTNIKKLFIGISWANECKTLSNKQLAKALKEKVWADMKIGTQHIALMEEAIDRLTELGPEDERKTND